MSRKHLRRELEVSISSLNRLGNGLGKTVLPDGQKIPIEVPFTLPGDEVTALTLRKIKGKYFSHLMEVRHPSPDRIPPRCNHFGTCGGCRWQQASYEKQLEFKENLVKFTFQNLITEDVIFHPIIPCEEPWKYRNKMEFSFSSDREKNRFLGLVMENGKGKVFNLKECHLVNPWMVDVVKAAREWWQKTDLEAFHPFTNVGSLRTLTVREGMRTGDRLVMLTVSGNPEYSLQRRHLETFVEAIKKHATPTQPNAKLGIFLRIHQAAKGMSTNFYEMLLDGADHIRENLEIQTIPGQPPFTFTFSISPTAFFQPNTYQAEKLYSIAFQLAQIPEDGIVYDLYCGTGTLGICAARTARQVIGIELSPESALDARTNAALNGLDNVTILSGAVRHVLSQIYEEKRFPDPDLAVIDPPRPGLDPEALKALIEVHPKRILYISCNPHSQLENIQEILQAGYKIRTIQPVDLFPQTPHVENIIILDSIKCK